MLERLHVRNLALIDETEVEFTKGLNILTGETGAGKSIIIGSVNLALGAKADKDLIRAGAEYALVELIFSLNEEQQRAVKELDLYPEEDGSLLLQRKISASKNVCKVNGENVSLSQLRELSGILLDMYGQQEHQSLLKEGRQREFLDAYAGGEMAKLKEELKEHYRCYRELEAEGNANRRDEAERIREADLLNFEVNEIEAAALREGEDEELEKSYRRMNNAKRIKTGVYAIYGMTGYEEENGAGEMVGRALRELKNIAGLDEEAEDLTAQLAEIDNLLNDFNRSVAEYRDSLTFDEEDYIRTEERLNTINRLKGKYGHTLAEILKVLQDKRERLTVLEDYDAYLANLEGQIRKEKDQVLQLCRRISALRETQGKQLAGKLEQALTDLNFLHVQFSIDIVPEEERLTEEGYDKITFMISTNPGEKKKPMAQIASGGELSRIMLAFKSVFAQEEGTDTLVFDEIDTGISGKTAWMVAEKLGSLAKNHQIICITHLPQIAAMEDSHYLIEKSVKEDRTITGITRLDEEQSLQELARLLGSGSVTEAVLLNAREIRELALKSKN